MTAQDRDTLARLRAWIDATPIVLKIGTSLLFAGSVFAAGLVGHLRGARLAAEVPERMTAVETKIDVVDRRVDSLAQRIGPLEILIPLADSLLRRTDRNGFLLCVLINRDLAADSPEILACGGGR